jgi:hypothetical protein
MNPERWFVEELQLIAPGVYPIWFDEYQKMFLAREYHRRVPGITEYNPRTGKHYIVELVLEDEDGNHIPLDQRLLHALRLMRYQGYTYKLDELLEKWKEPKRKEKERAKKELYERARDMFKMLYRLTLTKTFDLGGG